ncbi:MAG: peptide-methionine (S)-S-oxide reductase MsrA [Anaerolineaceae bacterium]|nr:peptide-methionine (S)-S-oxide reductase MsrA [Anaerolineaceae bacterium]
MNEKATLGGGCFWCIEAIYKLVDGVTAVTSGYAGGKTPNPTYKQVCDGITGHAEVVQVEFDPQIISYQEILEIFFSVHDPTTLNRQGADVGTQYRSIILTENDTQLQIARETIKSLSNTPGQKPVVTEVKPLETFYPAEDYHQDYFEKNPYQGYCRMVVAPKVNKFLNHYKK